MSCPGHKGISNKVRWRVKYNTYFFKDLLKYNLDITKLTYYSLIMRKPTQLYNHHLNPHMVHSHPLKSSSHLFTANPRSHSHSQPTVSPCLEISYQPNHATWSLLCLLPFILSFFHVVTCFSSSCLFLPSSIPWYEYITFCLPVLQVMDIWTLDCLILIYYIMVVY